MEDVVETQIRLTPKRHVYHVVQVSDTNRQTNRLRNRKISILLSEITSGFPLIPNDPLEARKKEQENVKANHNNIKIIITRFTVKT